MRSAPFRPLVPGLWACVWSRGRSCAVVLLMLLAVRGLCPAAGLAAEHSPEPQAAVTNLSPPSQYDTDGDGLIEISTLKQLDAMRHDLDGDGRPTAAGEAAYRRAFTALPADMQLHCDGGCKGYELLEDLDFDTDDSGAPNADDAYWADGAGWQPIGGNGNEFRTIFEGNGHTIRNLFINRPAKDRVGLFGQITDTPTHIRRVGLINVDVTGRSRIGGLVGRQTDGHITDCYVTGQVSGKSAVGGLVGYLDSEAGSITTSYATVQIRVSRDRNYGGGHAGGLVGASHGVITASYATGQVSGSIHVGGLAGITFRKASGRPASIRSDYATGPVRGGLYTGGLIGTASNSSSSVRDSYWDTETSGRTNSSRNSSRGTGKTTAALQTPTGSQGIYANWSRPWSGSAGWLSEPPWDFGTSAQYPALKADLNGDGTKTWQEFGHQLRERPTLTATVTDAEVVLRWEGVVTTHWTPAPVVTYTVYRERGSTVETIATGLSAATVTDTEVRAGTTYAYQVAAVVDGGEAVRSARRTVTIPQKGVRLSTTGPLETTEAGTTARFTVVLTAPPTADVTVAIESSDPSEGRVTPAELSFTPSTWETAQAVTVTGEDDTGVDGEQVYTVTFTLTSADTDYAGLAVPPVQVRNRDKDLPQNSPATGAPTISGPATAGQTLSASTSALADPNGLTQRAFAYQWIRVDGGMEQPIPEATGSTYTLEAADVGRQLKVRVRFTDDEGFSEERTSAAYPPDGTVQMRAAVVPDPGTTGGRAGGGGGSPNQDEHGNTPAQATFVTLDPTRTASVPGQINPAPDVDYFSVDVPYAGVLVVETSGPTATMGTVWQDGEELATADSGGVGRNFRLSARVAPGSVVIAVAGNGRQTGAYTLQVTSLPGFLENPGATSFQSGIGVISGWVCDAEEVEIVLNGEPQEAAYGTERLDTAGVCGDSDNGFGLLFNWNLLGDGEHEVVALVDGVELDRATVTVTTLRAEFLRDVTGTCTAADFPTMDETVTLAWQQTQQNFVIVDGPAPAGANRTGRAEVGYLENPGPNSFQSGIGVISGWVCEGAEVIIELNGAGQPASYGTERLDTESMCGDTANGFGLLFNWNLLGEGEHEVVALVDGEELGRATVRVTTLGAEFVRGVTGECTVEDFPMLGETVTLEWQQNSQNFVITAVE